MPRRLLQMMIKITSKEFNELIKRATTKRNLMGGKLSSSSRERQNTCFYVHHHFRCEKSVVVKKRDVEALFAAVDMRNEFKEQKKIVSFNSQQRK